jgi:ectoine hydroxylase-related dioxygenase (phytanoyl-CoA dioxygenase family)
MALCDGVLGRQVLRMDQPQFERCVVPPSLFTDDLPILTLPWELQDLCCARGSEVPWLSRAVREQGNAFGVHGMDHEMDVLWCLSGQTRVQLAPPPLGDSAGGGTPSAAASSASKLTWDGVPGQALIFLPSARAHLADGSTGDWLRASFHAAYLRQRQNLYLACPPQTALSLPAAFSRLMGYSKPGPVLNKLYCGTGDSSILEATRAYGSRAIDWAGNVAAQLLAKGAEPTSERTPGYVPSYASLTLPTLAQTATLARTLASSHLPTGVSVSASGLVTVEAETPHALDNALAAMLRDGCVVLAGAVSAERCDEAMEQLKPYSDDAGGGTVGSVLVRSEACWDFASHPLVLALCEAILGRQCLRLDDAATSARHRLLGAGFGFENGGRLPWQIHLALTIPKQAGGGKQELHRDGDLSLLDLAALGLEHAISVIWALDADFTEARGTTHVVPGSHTWSVRAEELLAQPQESRLPRATAAKDAQSFPAVMHRGSCLIYTGRTVHGAGHNTTAQPRVALNVAYNCAFLKQEENMYVATPPELARHLPAELQQLIGYT